MLFIGKDVFQRLSEGTDLQISLERTPSYLAPGRGARGWLDYINPLPRPIPLQEKTTQSREQHKLMVTGQDLFYILDILILKFKSDNGWVCLWLQGNVNIIVLYSCLQEKPTFILCDCRISSNSLV